MNDTEYNAEIVFYVLRQIKVDKERICILNQKKEKTWLDLCRERMEGKNALFVGDPFLMKEFRCCVMPFDVFRVYSCKEMLGISAYAVLLNQTTTLYDRIKIMQFATTLFNSPYRLTVSGGLGHIGAPKDIAYLFVAPYVIDFLQWFLKELCCEKVECLLLGARDGYLLEKLYKDYLKHTKYEKYPEAIYVYTSRNSTLLAGYETEADIIRAVEQPFLGGMEDMLLYRFEVPPEKIIPYDYTTMEDRKQYILKHKESIFENSRHARDNYYSYLDNLVRKKRYSKIAFFDLAASGSCQLFLERFIGQKILGLYFCRLKTTDQKKALLNIKSCYGENKTLVANMLFLETIFSSPEPNFRGVDDSGALCFGAETRNKQQIVYCMELQEGIEEYCRQWFEVVGDDFLTMEKTMHNDYFLDFLYKDYTIIENDIFNYYIEEDENVFSCSNLGNLYRY